MHRCTRSCFKYCRSGSQLKCRSNFPYEPSDKNEPVIYAYHDSKCRRQVRVLPRRNNANLNSTVISALLALAIAGNHDVQYISNSIGAGEYVASYTTKQELPDFILIGNFLYKRLATAFTDQKRLHAVATSVLDCTTVGSMEAIYLLLDLDLVEKSRDVENINPLHRSKLRKHLEMDLNKLENMSSEDKPYKMGLESNVGKRKAYEELMQQQRGEHGNCFITYYTLLGSFKLTAFQNKNSTHLNLTNPPLLEIDEYGRIRNQVESFRVNEVVYKKRKRNAVLNPCPYIPVDCLNDTSCYGILLFHVPWPLEGESEVPTNEYAVKTLEALQESNALPKYAVPLIERLQKSQQLFNNPQVEIDNNPKEDEEFDDEEEVYCPYDNFNQSCPYDENWVCTYLSF